MFKKTLLSIGLALCLLLVTFAPALADRPGIYDFPIFAQIEMTDVCDFPVIVDATTYIHWIGFFSDGSLIRVQVVQNEQDTFRANGKSLVGIPYHNNFVITYDENGDINGAVMHAVISKVLLPDGSLFISAGWLNMMDHDQTFFISPDRGNSGNIEGFCAALAP